MRSWLLRLMNPLRSNVIFISRLGIRPARGCVVPRHLLTKFREVHFCEYAPTYRGGAHGGSAYRDDDTGWNQL